MKNQNKNKFWPKLPSNQAPVWVASHSPISLFDVDRQVDLYCEYENAGVALLSTGEIFLNRKYDNMRGPVIRMKGFKSPGGDPEAICLFGPPGPNLLSPKQGLELVGKITKRCKKPIVANVCDFSQEQEWGNLLCKLVDAGASAFEIALSCPNLNYVNDFGVWIEKNITIVKKIKKLLSVPISLKIQYRHLAILGAINLLKILSRAGVDQITVFDAPKSICPPNVSNDISSPYESYDKLCFGGISGPWDRYLLYGVVAELRQAKEILKDCKINISAVGGIMSSTHIVELLSLGANNVQLSSVVLWKGFGIISKIITEFNNYLNKNHDFAANDRLLEISDNPTDGLIAEHGVDYWKKWMNRRQVSSIDETKCIGCKLCCETTCLARCFKNGKIQHEKELCSGCGWCREICPSNAISMVKHRSFDSIGSVKGLPVLET